MTMWLATIFILPVSANTLLKHTNTLQIKNSQSHVPLLPEGSPPSPRFSFSLHLTPFPFSSQPLQLKKNSVGLYEIDLKSY